RTVRTLIRRFAPPSPEGEGKKLLRATLQGTATEPSKTAGGEAGFDPPSLNRNRWMDSCLRRWCRPQRIDERLISERTPQQGTWWCRRIGRMPMIRLVRVHRAWSAMDSSEEAMPLNLAQKKELVAELAEVAAKAHSLVAAEYAGLTVEQLTEL